MVRKDVSDMRITRKQLLWTPLLATTGAAVAFHHESRLLATAVRAMTRLTDQFRPRPGEPRGMFESGAEAQARAIAQALPVAVQTVETRQYGPFVSEIQRTENHATVTHGS